MTKDKQKIICTESSNGVTLPVLVLVTVCVVELKCIRVGFECAGGAGSFTS